MEKWPWGSLAEMDDMTWAAHGQRIDGWSMNGALGPSRAWRVWRRASKGRETGGRLEPWASRRDLLLTVSAMEAMSCEHRAAPNLGWCWGMASQWSFLGRVQRVRRRHVRDHASPPTATEEEQANRAGGGGGSATCDGRAPQTIGTTWGGQGTTPGQGGAVCLTSSLGGSEVPQV